MIVEGWIYIGIEQLGLWEGMPMGSGQGRAFRVGDFECRVLFDGARSIGAMTDDPAETFIFGDAPEEELRRCLQAYSGLTLTLR